MPSRSYPAPKFSKEEIAFLDAPGATHDEAVATLGAPLIDLRDPGVLAYTREVTARARYTYPDWLADEWRSDVVKADAKIWVLFIAYDRHGQVLAHEVCTLETGELEKASVAWRLAKVKDQ